MSERPEDRPSGSWIVIREGRDGRWGGELRRHSIFDRLALRTHAQVIEEGWYPRLLRVAARGRLGILPGPLLYALPSQGPKPRFAASERLRDGLLDAARHLTDPTVVAIYDDPVAQARALGVAIDRSWAAEVDRLTARSVAAFRWLVVPTASFGRLAGLDADRVIVGGNGTDTRRIQVGAWPLVPTVGVVSAAAPGRGLERLVEATQLAREALPDTRLRMWLVAIGDAGARYLDQLRRECSAMPWVEIATAPYERLGEALASATVLTIPHPANDYLDVALPVKLFEFGSRWSSARGHAADRDGARRASARHRLGHRGRHGGRSRRVDRRVAQGRNGGEGPRRPRARRGREEIFDWHVVGDRIADEVLRRESTRGSGCSDERRIGRRAR